MSDSEYHSLSQDMVFDLLSNSRRRFVLHYLERADGPVRLSELAAEIAAIENEVSTEELTSQQRKRTYVSLYQTHIPKLQDAGAVSYDAETGMVELASGAGEIGEYFQKQGTDRPWQYYYLVLAGSDYCCMCLLRLLASRRVSSFCWARLCSVRSVSLRPPTTCRSVEGELISQRISSKASSCYGCLPPPSRRSRSVTQFRQPYSEPSFAPNTRTNCLVTYVPQL